MVNINQVWLHMAVYFETLFGCAMHLRPGGYNSMRSRASRLIAAIFAVSPGNFSDLLLLDRWGMRRTTVALDEAY